MHALFTLAVALVLAAPAASAAETPPDPFAERVRAGIERVQEGDLESGVATLEEVASALAADPRERKRLALVSLYLSVACLGLDRPDEARVRMEDAVRLDPELVVDPEEFAPRVVRLHREVKHTVAARPDAVAAAPATKAPDAKGSRGLGLGLAAGAAAGAAVAVAAGGSDSSPPSAPPPPARAISTIRLFNCDDSCRAYLNGALVSEVGLGQDSGLFDITNRLVDGPNEIVFELINARGGIAYGFQVRRGEAIVFQEACGIALRAGCEDDRRFPPGVVRTFVYQLDNRP